MNINEIATMADVSRATVSRYLNDGYVSKEKRERIQNVIEQTGYKPSAQAQMLRTKKTRQVGVILPKIDSESIGRMVTGIGGVLREAGFMFLLADTENQEAQEVEYLKAFGENQVDGIILIATSFTKAHMEALRALQVPVVILGQRLEGYSCVYQDDYHAARAATGILMEGAQHMGYIGVAQENVAIGINRRQGFLDAMEEGKAEWNEDCYEESGHSVQDGYQAAKELFERHPEVDAVFCATDAIALGALKQIQESGRKVPQQVAVMGVGDMMFGQVVEPKLSSVHLQYRTSGEEAARLLLDMMDGNSAEKEIQMGYSARPRETTRKAQ